jgi:hypothetical protein
VRRDEAPCALTRLATRLAINVATQGVLMNSISKTLLCACVVLSANAGFAQDAMKKDEAMAKDGMMKKDMTMQECKDHMAMAKKDGMKKDDAMMKKDTLCADMMKKDGMRKDEPMKK